MLGRLLKHELIDYFKKTTYIFLAVIGASFLIFGINIVSEYADFLNYALPPIMIGYIISTVGMFIYCLVYPMIRYYKSMLKDEGYLTHTLPIDVTKILFVKLLAALILFITAAILFIASLLITKIINLEDLKLFLTIISDNNFISLLILIGYAIIFYYTNLLLVITSMTIGYSKSNNKVAFSFVVGIILYFVQQFLGIIYLVILVIINPNFYNETNPTIANLKLIMLGPIIISLLLITVNVVLTNYFLRNKLNLE